MTRSTSQSEAELRPDDSPLAEPLVRERLRDLPPSAKLVATILSEDAPLAQGEIAERSLLPDRTVRYALTRLDEAALVETRPSVQDARKRVYLLGPPPE